MGNIEVKDDQRKYVKVFVDFLETDKLDRNDKMVFICLKKYANNDTHQAFPSLKTLSKMAGLSVTWLKRSLKRLEKIGVLSIEKRTSKNRGNESNLYTLYDYACLWDKGIADVEKTVQIGNEKLSEAAMIAELEKRGYNISKKSDSDMENTTKNDDFSNEIDVEDVSIKDTVKNTEKHVDADRKIMLKRESDMPKMEKSVQICVEKPANPTIEKTETVEEMKTSEPEQPKMENKTVSKSTQPQFIFKRQYIQDHFNYDVMIKEHPDMAEMIEMTMDILYDILNTDNDIKIGKENKPANVVHGMVMKLTKESIIFAINKFNEVTDEIHNIKAYFTTMLYKAPNDYALSIKSSIRRNFGYMPC